MTFSRVFLEIENKTRFYIGLLILFSMLKPKFSLVRTTYLHLIWLDFVSLQGLRKFLGHKLLSFLWDINFYCCKLFPWKRCCFALWSMTSFLTSHFIFSVELFSYDDWLINYSQVVLIITGIHQYGHGVINMAKIWSS